MISRIFVILSFSFLSVLASASNTPVLYENRLGNLYLNHDMKIDLNTLKATLKDYEITKNIGQQDGPDFAYYEAKKDGVEYFWIKAQDENEKLLDQIYITNKSIIDKYGVKIGMSYKQIKFLRKNIKVTTEHYHTYAYVTGSNIAYEITGNINGPDKESYSEDEIISWKVSEIKWLKLNQ